MEALLIQAWLSRELARIVYSLSLCSPSRELESGGLPHVLSVADDSLLFVPFLLVTCPLTALLGWCLAQCCTVNPVLPVYMYVRRVALSPHFLGWCINKYQKHV
jgi:hypothetical protein